MQSKRAYMSLAILAGTVLLAGLADFSPPAAAQSVSSQSSAHVRLADLIEQLRSPRSHAPYSSPGQHLASVRCGATEYYCADTTPYCFYCAAKSEYECCATSDVTKCSSGC
jgi:hypothetical protein